MADHVQPAPPLPKPVITTVADGFVTKAPAPKEK